MFKRRKGAASVHTEIRRSGEAEAGSGSREIKSASSSTVSTVQSRTRTPPPPSALAGKRAATSSGASGTSPRTTMLWSQLTTTIAFAYVCRNHPLAAAFGQQKNSPVTINRRLLIKDAAAAAAALPLVVCGNKQPVLAVAPFAPVDTLLPAARVKVCIDDAVNIASSLVAEENMEIRKELLQKLDKLLLQPQQFTRGTTPIDVPQQPAKSYLNAYAEYRKQVSILEKPGAALVQNGEIDAWRRLKREERAQEDADEIRAALNYYTSNLNFSADKFVLTGTSEEKSRMIRGDQVPDVKLTIASDMGLRYLRRNEILTACADARAELRYQMRQDMMEGQDLMELLLGAQRGCSQWFDLIDSKDAATAIDIARKEAGTNTA